jgi:ElaB/YqjD/DUF883 family membrane-anchored ribosome-binding protein
MVADPEVSREPQSLREELFASLRDHPSSPVSGNARTAPQTSQPIDAANDQQPHGTVGKFIEAITDFLEQEEKKVSAHPAAHVIGGIVVGILIGRLLGQR